MLKPDLPLLHHPARRDLHPCLAVQPRTPRPAPSTTTGSMVVRQQVIDCSNKNPRSVCVISTDSETSAERFVLTYQYLQRPGRDAPLPGRSASGARPDAAPAQFPRLTLLIARSRQIDDDGWLSMFEGLDAVVLARAQFAFTMSFHIVFPAFSIGLASYLAVLEALWLWTGREVFINLFNYWLKIFAIAFGMGVVSGIVMSYQFGTNWSAFSDKAGPVIGPLMAYEVLTAFFLEAGFLGVMLFGLSASATGCISSRP